MCSAMDLLTYVIYKIKYTFENRYIVIMMTIDIQGTLNATFQKRFILYIL